MVEYYFQIKYKFLNSCIHKRHHCYHGYHMQQIKIGVRSHTKKENPKVHVNLIVWHDFTHFLHLTEKHSVSKSRQEQKTNKSNSKSKSKKKKSGSPPHFGSFTQIIYSFEPQIVGDHLLEMQGKQNNRRLIQETMVDTLDG